MSRSVPRGGPPQDKRVDASVAPARDMPSTNELDSELESFRRQWLSDLRATRPAPGVTEASASDLWSAIVHKSVPSLAAGSSSGAYPRRESTPQDDEDYVQARAFDEISVSSSSGSGTKNKELVSALDHYEEAVEKETLGSLGDSLKLYRKAFRMDSRVDQQYKKKHFPGGVSKSTPSSSSNAPPTLPDAQPSDTLPQSMSDMLASFAGLSITPAPPHVEGTPAPPCPIADLPEEILVHILRDVAIQDVGDFARLAQVCRRFAYLVAAEERIWKRICLGSEVGFGTMHYQWQRDISWDPLVVEQAAGEMLLSPEEDSYRQRQRSLLTSQTLLSALYGGSWQKMFKERWRIRFNGCYISTVNYIRVGQANTNQITWNSPIHIVTYYRYLRFFRDGTAISLLTTSEPSDVVHHLTKDNMALHQDGGPAHLPSAVMQEAFRGRWRLSSAEDEPGAAPGQAEGDLYVETEAVPSKYIYRLELSLRSAGKGARNNKLVWRGFYSYNKLTDDWGEFARKNDKPYFFSRVRSYGSGE